MEQLHKIFKLCGSPSEDYWRKSKLHKSTVFKPSQPYRRRLAETFKDFPDAAVGLMDTLLAIDPAHRGTAAIALKSEVCYFLLLYEMIRFLYDEDAVSFEVNLNPYPTPQRTRDDIN